MKYYLGRLKSGKYEPINCIEETDILSLINYTSNFYDEVELKNELVSKNLIDGNEPLAYVYNKKDEYYSIPNGNNLAYSSSKEYLQSNDIYKKFKEEKYNLEFYEYIASVIESKLHNVTHKVAELTSIRELLNEVNYANTIGIDKYEETKDKKNLDLLIMRFLTSFFCIWDKDKKQYKVTNGQYDTNKRKVVDLILILNSYYDAKSKESLYTYIPSDNKKNTQNEYEEIEGYDKEEFLTNEDFENYGMNPEDYKKLIRN